MVIQDFAVYFILFIFADIILYMVVMKGLLMTSMTGRTPAEQAELDKLAQGNAPTFTVELRHTPANQAMRPWVRERGSANAARMELAEQVVPLSTVAHQELQNLNLAEVRFVPPQGLRVGETARLEMVVNQNIVDGVTRALNAAAPSNITTLSIGALLQATLRADGFAVSTPNPTAQRLKAGTVTVWTWEVVPLKAGTKKLGFDLQLELRTASGEERRSFNWHNGDAEVARNTPFVLKNFLRRYWWAVLLATPVPVAAAYGVWHYLQ